MSAPWWETGVLYHVYLRSFQDSNGDGVGDLRGLTHRLPYLSWLGVDTVWVSPFYVSPMRDFGYDVQDHTAVDPLFGTLDDFDEMLARAHGLGLRVIVDWIPNHTASDHRWFEASRDPSSALRDFYYWRDGGEDTVPNNWPSAFGGPAWSRDGRSGAHYLHLCLPEMPDLNWHNPAVEKAQFEVARFWLDRGVDGFRVDVAHWIGKHPDLPDNPPDDGSAFINPAKPPSAFDRVAHIYDMDGPLAHAVYRRFRALLGSYDPPRMAMGEIHLGDLKRWAAYYGADDELHLPAYFGLLSVPFDAEALAAAILQQEGALPAGAWPTYVLGNHDEPRLASRIGAERVRLAAVLLLTLRGTPTLYYGDELGLESISVGEAAARDPLGMRVPGLGRDGGRAPMPWTAGVQAGFCPAAATPWLPIPPGYHARSVACQQRDFASLLHLYRKLLYLRRQHEVLQRGALADVAVRDGVLSFVRLWKAEQVRVCLNFGRQPAALPAGKVLLRTGTGSLLGSNEAAIIAVQS